jgi:hypothetical protein
MTLPPIPHLIAGVVGVTVLGVLGYEGYNYFFKGKSAPQLGGGGKHHHDALPAAAATPAPGVTDAGTTTAASSDTNASVIAPATGPLVSVPSAPVTVVMAPKKHHHHRPAPPTGPGGRPAPPNFALAKTPLPPRPAVASSGAPIMSGDPVRDTIALLAWHSYRKSDMPIYRRAQAVLGLKPDGFPGTATIAALATSAARERIAMPHLPIYSFHAFDGVSGPAAAQWNAR